MDEFDRSTQLLIRRRRDFSDAFEACSDESDSDMDECMCRHGQSIWCEDAYSVSPTPFSTLVVTIIIGTVLLLISFCICFACHRRRSRGTVFRTPSGRTLTTTTTTVVQPLASQTSGATSYPTQQQQWIPPQEGGFPQPPPGAVGSYQQPQQPGYQQSQIGYQQPQAGYPQSQAGAPQPQGGYPQPQPQPGFAQPQPGYPQPQPGFAQPQPGYPQQQPGFAPATPAPGAADLPPPYDTATGHQPPFNPGFQEGGDSKRPL